MNYQRLKLFSCFIGLLMLAASGCGKKSAPPPAVSAEASPSSASPATSQAGPPVAHTAPPSQVSLPASASPDAAAEQLSIELRRYVLSTRSIPKNFEDFVARHPMKFPPPPSGKRYVIAEGKVVVQ